LGAVFPGPEPDESSLRGATPPNGTAAQDHQTTGEQPLHLTPAQIAAAMALGIRFTPATSDQVQRLAMQRKVFRIDEAPHLATRDGSFFEIAAHHADEAQQQADLVAWEASSTAAPSPSTQSAPDAMLPRPAIAPATVPETLTHLAEEPAPPVAVAEAARPRTPRRRSPHQRAPGWMTAGAERRGRVDQHWSTRARQ
jgi:hypothetical protein